MDAANSGLSILKSGTDLMKTSYEAAEAKHRYRQLLKPKYVVNLKLKNSTKYTWKMPQVYFARGSSDSCLPLEVRPGEFVDWEAASPIFRSHLEVSFRYDFVTEEAPVSVGVMFCLRRRWNYPFRVMIRCPMTVCCSCCQPCIDPCLTRKLDNCLGQTYISHWAAEVFKTTDVVGLGKRKWRQRNLHQYLVDEDNVNDGDGCTIEKSFLSGSFSVVGAMAPSKNPEISIDVKEDGEEDLQATLSGRRERVPLRMSSSPGQIPEMLKMSSSLNVDRQKLIE
eukprot:m.306623 g.306623  ORF g.306623 m.306623 type:complete len:280 (+) comp41412_c0_seq1:76-915(+)